MAEYFCHKNCQSCYGPESNQCLSCRENAIGLFNGECQCPDPHLMVEGQCECGDGFYELCESCDWI